MRISTPGHSTSVVVPPLASALPVVAFDEVLKKSKGEELKTLLVPQPATSGINATRTAKLTHLRTDCPFHSPTIF
ncbi:MAG TPA: hypothetical protein VEH02_08480 [Pseudolabrys sp.]|nr:hypothetical protein [Pseudolabrys sp.]